MKRLKIGKKDFEKLFLEYKENVENTPTFYVQYNKPRLENEFSYKFQLFNLNNEQYETIVDWSFEGNDSQRLDAFFGMINCSFLESLSPDKYEYLLKKISNSNISDKYYSYLIFYSYNNFGSYGEKKVELTLKYVEKFKYRDEEVLKKVLNHFDLNRDSNPSLEKKFRDYNFAYIFNKYADWFTKMLAPSLEPNRFYIHDNIGDYIENEQE